MSVLYVEEAELALAAQPAPLKLGLVTHPDLGEDILGRHKITQSQAA